jgi:hypothetical protein
VFSYASVNTHRVWETSIERGETSIECGKRPSSVGKHTSSVGKHPSSVGKRGVYRGVAEGGPRRAGLSEREDAGRGGVPLDESLGGVGVK